MINYKSLPKVELHLHLDTSMKVETIRKYLTREKIEIPEPLESYCIAPDKCENLMDYLDRIPLVQLLVVREQRTRAGRVDDPRGSGEVTAQLRE